MTGLKSNIFLLILIIFVLQTGTDGRVRRKRRGVWPDILAPGGNTFASLGYYGMQSYIAYPESGIAMNPFWQQNSLYPTNPFNNFIPNNYNPMYPYGSSPGNGYGGSGMNPGMPYLDPGNYNPFPPNFMGNMMRTYRSGSVNSGSERVASVSTKLSQNNG